MADQQPYLGSPDHPRTPALVCYMTLIGWLVARFALYPGNKNVFVAMHLRQTLLLHILSIALNLLAGLVYWPFNGNPWFIGLFAALLIFLWIKGILDVVNGNEKPLPIIGELAQKLFRNI